jgi:DNA-binding NtrC family response regulator
MRTARILIVDDEPSVRLVLEEALAPLEAEILSVGSVSSALADLEQQPISVILLDLRLEEEHGLAVLRAVAERHPETRVIIVTAHGTVNDAVDAMRLGAADFISKPFDVPELRALVQRCLDRDALDAERVQDYWQHIELAKQAINARQFDAAREHARRAVGDRPDLPDAFNLLGVLEEIGGRRVEALRQYRIALELDSTHKPARENLARATQPLGQRKGGMYYE